MTSIGVALRGMAMGMAEVVPGVSGGTIAFITNIYERLLNDIKSIGPDGLKAWQEGGFKAFWKAIDGNFLVTLVVGMVVGLLVGIKGITYLLEAYPPMVWGFFFGLIIGSSIYIFRKIKDFNVYTYLWLLIGAGIAYMVTVVSPIQGSDALPVVFGAGAIAVSAMLLPGLSGSFILLILGMYRIILGSVEHALQQADTASMTIVGVFILGGVFGLVTFSRILTWAFKNYHNQVLALLTGFMIGSLNKIWPWRAVVETRINSAGEAVPFIEHNVLPAQYDGDPMIIATAVAFIIGVSIVFIIEFFGDPSQTSAE